MTTHKHDPKIPFFAQIQGQKLCIYPNPEFKGGINLVGHLAEAFYQGFLFTRDHLSTMANDKDQQLYTNMDQFYSIEGFSILFPTESDFDLGAGHAH